LSETRVLLLGDAKSDAVARVLALHDRSVTQVADADEAIRVAPEHAIVVIDAVAAPRTIASVCRDIRAVPELAEIPVLAISATDDVEDRIRLLEAGADDVMARPVDERELDARIEALDLRSRRSKQLRPGTVVSSTRRLGRRLIVVFSPKGGAGTTTVALNLALAIAARDTGEVAVIDLVQGTGSVATYLNAHPRLTIADMARDTLALGDPAAVRTYLTSADKIVILAGRPGPWIAPRRRPGERRPDHRDRPVGRSDGRGGRGLRPRRSDDRRDGARGQRRPRRDAGVPGAPVPSTSFSSTCARSARRSATRRWSSTRSSNVRCSRRPTSRGRSGGPSPLGSRTIPCSSSGRPTRAPRSTSRPTHRRRRGASRCWLLWSSEKDVAGGAAEPRRRRLGALFGRS